MATGYGVKGAGVTGHDASVTVETGGGGESPESRTVPGMLGCGLGSWRGLMAPARVLSLSAPFLEQLGTLPGRGPALISEQD